MPFLRTDIHTYVGSVHQDDQCSLKFSWKLIFLLHQLVGIFEHLVFQLIEMTFHCYILLLVVSHLDFKNCNDYQIESQILAL